MPTHECPPEILDRLIELNDQCAAVVQWLRTNPLAHPAAVAEKWELYDALDAEYDRLHRLRQRYEFPKGTWTEPKKIAS